MANIIQSENGKAKPYIAIGALVLSVGSLYFADALLMSLYNCGRISSMTASVIIFACALMLFILLLRVFSLRSVYSLDGVKLSFSRVYIKKPRTEEQVFLREIVYFGLPEAADPKYAPKRTRRFIQKREGVATRALIYRREQKYYRILFSPNAEMTDALEQELRRKK